MGVIRKQVVGGSVALSAVALIVTGGVDADGRVNTAEAVASPAAIEKPVAVESPVLEQKPARAVAESKPPAKRKPPAKSKPSAETEPPAETGPKADAGLPGCKTEVVGWRLPEVGIFDDASPRELSETAKLNRLLKAMERNLADIRMPSMCGLGTSLQPFPNEFPQLPGTTNSSPTQTAFGWPYRGGAGSFADPNVPNEYKLGIPVETGGLRVPPPPVYRPPAPRIRIAIP